MVSLSTSKMCSIYFIPFGDQAITFWVMLDSTDSHIHSLRFLRYSSLNRSFSVVSNVLETQKSLLMKLFKDTQQKIV